MAPQELEDLPCREDRHEAPGQYPQEQELADGAQHGVTIAAAAFHAS
jgi:hypothetical protein